VLVWGPPVEEPEVRTSRLAIASTVSGVVSILCSVGYRDSYVMCLFIFISVVAGISALGCGLAALACIELDHPRLRGRFYALIGILLCTIAFAIIDALFANR
jgi:hypothetical protein